ncbi:MAG: DNA translocase FtsK [Gemmatimonadota bacterium]
MLSDRQRAEALGVGLMGLGLLIALSILYPAVAGEGENLVGPAGEALHRAARAAFGHLGALSTLPAFFWGAKLLRLASRRTAVRWTLLSVLLLLLGPALVHLIGALGGGGAAGAGWIGVTLGGLLADGLGNVGAILVGLATLLTLSILTLGWSPVGAAAAGARSLRAISSSVGKAGRAIFRALRAAGGGIVDLYRDGRPRETVTPWESAPPAKVEAPAEGASGAGAGRKGKRSRSAGPEGQLPLFDPGDLSQTELPPVELLTVPTRRSSGLDGRELRALGEVLVEKLSTFKVEGRIGGWTTGPVVTQFEVVPAAGVTVGQIAARADDLALALRAPSVRIVAPIPGKGAVGVEVPNPEPEIVYLREILQAPAYRGSRTELTLALGRDLSGEPYCAGLVRMPHLLIAGATGSGKSVCINTIITSLVYRYTPRQLRLLMVDPKMVELSVYRDLPHLRHPVVTDNEEAASVLKWAVYEMKRRFSLLSANRSRNVGEFNRRVRGGEALRSFADGEPGAYEGGELPYIVLIVDELADLIMTVQAEVETPLAMLAQKARAVGLHLVVATQRPSVNVITGLIKANFPSRIAFRVASKTDSRTILDQNGAESLLGNGDMLFLPPGEADPVRIQGAFVSSGDTERILDWYRAQAARPEEAAEEQDILEVVRELEEEEARAEIAEDVVQERDELFRRAAELVIHHGAGSTSLLQRRLKVGYGRAARIIDQLHNAGIVGPAEGSKPREVLVRLEDLERLEGEE